MTATEEKSWIDRCEEHTDSMHETEKKLHLIRKEMYKWFRTLQARWDA